MGLLERLSLNSSPYMVEDFFGFGEENVRIDFGSAEDQIYPHDDAHGESNFGVFRGIE